MMVTLVDSTRRTYSSTQSRKSFRLISIVMAILIYRIPSAVRLCWLRTNLWAAWLRNVRSRLCFATLDGLIVLNPARSSFTAFLFLALYPLLVLPLTTYFTDPSSYGLSGIQTVASFAAAGFAFALIIAALISLPLTEKYRGGLFCFLLFCCLVIFYNFNFHNYEGKIIGVDTDVFDRNFQFLDILLYAALAAAIGLARRHIVSDQIAIAVFFLAANIVLLGTQIIGSRSGESTHGQLSQGFSIDGLYEFSSEKNFLHIVLDGFEGSVFSKLLAEHPEFYAEFDGFTFFPDATTASEVTYLALPSGFSGIQFEGSQPISQYLAVTGFGGSESGLKSNTPH